jgi:hypothetical protein
VYDLSNGADPNVEHGAETLRRDVPKLVCEFMASYAATRANVLHAKLRELLGDDYAEDSSSA